MPTPNDNVLVDWLSFAQHLVVPVLVIYLPGAHDWYEMVRDLQCTANLTHLVLMGSTQAFLMPRSRERFNVFVHRFDREAWSIDLLIILGALKVQFIRSTPFWLGERPAPKLMFVGKTPKHYNMRYLCERAGVAFDTHFEEKTAFLTWMCALPVTGKRLADSTVGTRLSEDQSNRIE